MKDEVKVCVDAKLNFFKEYMIMPAAVEGEFDDFSADVIALGQNCQTAIEFEEKFNSTGLINTFNSIYSRCSQKPVKMTAEQKKESRRIMKEMAKEEGWNPVTSVLEDIADHARVEAECELATHRRETMIENGTFTDYTIASNKVNRAKKIFDLFKKKK